MFLQDISLINFRNYEESQLRFSRDVNCLTGDNGAGKTNLLDAIHYLALCKSYFNPVDNQQVRENTEFFMVQGTFERLGTSELISCSYRRSQKKIFRRNKKDYTRLADHIGLFPLVMISPNDISLILGGSEERRKFMDNALSQTNHHYLEELINYNKALQSRNAMLKGARGAVPDPTLLDIYSSSLAKSGNYIFCERRAFMTAFSQLFSRDYAWISTESEAVSLTYTSQLVETSYERGLEQVLERDIITERTNFGIHKDDLELKIGGQALKKHGSQGQQKSFLIALKLAHYSYLYSQSGLKPILLLDDIFDKLDEKRINRLMQMVVRDDFGQIILTDAHLERVERIFKGIPFPVTLFSVVSGTINAIDSHPIQ